MIRSLQDVGSARAGGEAVPAGLDWQAFSAVYFAGRHRHDLKAITAYGAYRRARTVEERTSHRGHRAEDEADESTESTIWEDEGGAVSWSPDITPPKRPTP